MERNLIAVQMAADVVEQTLEVHDICQKVGRCPDCRMTLTLPVTGYCGHTRCFKCIEENRACYCGCLAPMPRHPNILIQNIMEKTILPQVCQAESEAELSPVSTIACDLTGRQKDRSRFQPYLANDKTSTTRRNQCQIPNIEIRYKYCQELMSLGMFREAVLPLAHAATSYTTTFAQKAFDLLVQSVDLLLRDMEQTQLARELYHDVRSRCMSFSLTPVDLECSICLQLLNDPVTTPCGHTFCRECILLTMKAVHGAMQRQCAFCRSPLDYLTIVLTSETSFLTSLIMTVAPSARVPSMPRRKWMPIFKCTEALPTVPCPVLILDPQHCEIIKRILASGKRRIGMVTAGGNNTCRHVYGTIIEVRDCFELRNGDMFLTTIGIKRFQAQGTDFDGSYIACVTEWDDDAPVEHPEALQVVGDQIISKARRWLAMLDNAVVSDIMYAHGPMPELLHVDDWWTDDYKWLWWMIAILPMKPKLKMLILSTNSLFKRMTAVSFFLDLVLRQMMGESN